MMVGDRAMSQHSHIVADPLNPCPSMQQAGPEAALPSPGACPSLALLPPLLSPCPPPPPSLSVRPPGGASPVVEPDRYVHGGDFSYLTSADNDTSVEDSGSTSPQVERNFAPAWVTHIARYLFEVKGLEPWAGEG